MQYFLTSLAITIVIPLIAMGEEKDRVPELSPIKQFGSPKMGHIGRITALACSRDNKYLVSYGEDRFIRLWEESSGNLFWKLQVDTPMGSNGLDFSPSGKLLASCWDSTSLSLIDTGTGIRRIFAERKDLLGVTRAVKFSPDGNWLATVEDKTEKSGQIRVTIWDIKKLSPIKTFYRESNTSLVHSLSFSNDEKYLALGMDSGSVIWEIESGKEIPLSDQKGVRPSATIHFLPQQNHLLLCHPLEIRIQDFQEKKGVGEIAKPNDIHFNKCAMIAGGSSCITSMNSGALVVWDLQTLQKVQTLKGHFQGDVVLATGKDPNKCYSAGPDGSIRKWNLKTGKELSLPVDVSESINGLQASKDPKTILTSGADRMVRKWNISTGKIEESWNFARDQHDQIHFFALSPDERFLAVWLRNKNDHSIRIYDFESKKIVRMFDSLFSLPLKLQWVQRGEELNLFMLFESGRVEGKPVDNPGLIFAYKPQIQWNPVTLTTMNQQFVVLYQCGNELLAIDPFKNKEVFRKPIVGTLESAQVCPQSQYLWTWQTLNSTQSEWLYSLHPFSERTAFPANRESYRKAYFSSDSRYFAVISDAYSSHCVDVFESVTMTPCAQLCGHRGRINDVHFFPRSSILLTVSADSTMMQWDLSQLGNDPIHKDASSKFPHWWADLEKDDAVGQQAVWNFIRTSPKGLEWIREKLPASKPYPEKELTPLIEGLENKSFRIRNATIKKLAAIGPVIEPRMKELLKENRSSPMNDGVNKVLTEMKQLTMKPYGESLRQIRAVQVLEYIGNEEARKVLENWSKGTSGTFLTEEALRAVNRLREK
jgi:WD40 repeat protein